MHNSTTLSERPWWRLLIIPVALVLASMVMVATAAAAGSNGIRGELHDLEVHNPKGKKSYLVCETWTNRTTTASSCTSETHRLYAGENTWTEFGWDDTDGILVPAGWSLVVSSDSKIGDGDDSTLAGCRATSFWRKVSPSLLDPGINQDWYYLVDCPKY